MSGKSKHGRGKSSLQSKKKRNMRRGSQQVAVAQPQRVAAPQNVARGDKKTAVPVEVSVALSGVAAAATAGVDYPNLPYELRRVGILAGIMLAALIILALILG